MYFFFFKKIKLPKVIPKLDSSLSIMQVPEVVGTVQYRAYCSMLLLSILIVLIKIVVLTIYGCSVSRYRTGVRRRTGAAAAAPRRWPPRRAGAA